ncbi:MAG: ATP-binding protein [Kiritimatiellaeota bacterium]|nr:ATP-binding protein [Kiritimatiellota bacterium]
MKKPLFEHAYGAVLAELIRRLQEPAPGRVQLLTGPRQVGKTTLLGEIEARWPGKTLYLAADAPEAALPGWWERQWQRAREQAAGAGGAVLLLDEAHGLPDWNRLLKHAADRLQREHLPLHVVVTGSSALLLGKGSQETMAGRFERLRLLHWPAAELADRLHIRPADAAGLTVTHGGYPGAMALRHDDRRFRRYLLDSIIEPAIGRDLALAEAVRKPAMLRQVFAISVGHPAQILSLQKIQGALSESGSLATVAHYLRLLEDGYLVAAIAKYSRHVVRQRAAPPKLVVLNNGLLDTGGGAPPKPTAEPERWGRWVENACIALAWNAGQRLWYWREDPHEVDFISEGTWGRLAVEVKTGAFTSRDLAGLLEFQRRYPDFAPLVLCDPGREATARQLGLPALSWKDFLFQGPPDPTAH